jgi:hypothetical protein
MCGHEETAAADYGKPNEPPDELPLSFAGLSLGAVLEFVLVVVLFSQPPASAQLANNRSDSVMKRNIGRWTPLW